MIVPRWRLICGGHYNGVSVGRVVRTESHAYPLCQTKLAYCHCEERSPHLSLRAQRGNLVAVAMVVCRRVFNLNEIATSLRSSQ